MIFNAISGSSGQFPVIPIGGHKMDIFEATQRFGADTKIRLQLHCNSNSRVPYMYVTTLTLNYYSLYVI